MKPNSIYHNLPSINFFLDTSLLMLNRSSNFLMHSSQIFERSSVVKPEDLVASITRIQRQNNVDKIDNAKATITRKPFCLVLCCFFLSWPSGMESILSQIDRVSFFAGIGIKVKLHFQFLVSHFKYLPGGLYPFTFRFFVYRIFFSSAPQRLFRSAILRCGAYWRVACKRGCR